jgi:hypothetical protein
MIDMRLAPEDGIWLLPQRIEDCAAWLHEHCETSIVWRTPIPASAKTHKHASHHTGNDQGTFLAGSQTTALHGLHISVGDIHRG